MDSSKDYENYRGSIKLKLTYTTFFNYYHRIIDTGKLVDEACAENHYHKDVKLIVKIPTNDEFLDFKTIKATVERVLTNYNEKNITDDFGLMETEGFVTVIQAQIQDELNRPADVLMQETSKYGIEVAGN